MDIYPGLIVKAIAGRDKDKYFVVLSVKDESFCYIADGKIFSGDTLFKVGIGRTDLPGGHLRTLVNSLRRIGALQGDFEIFPGHGESTTLSYELTQNSLLRSK